jgi:hypothetical protein
VPWNLKSLPSYSVNVITVFVDGSGGGALRCAEKEASQASTTTIDTSGGALVDGCHGWIPEGVRQFSGQ